MTNFLKDLQIITKLLFVVELQSFALRSDISDPCSKYFFQADLKKQTCYDLFSKNVLNRDEI